MINHRVWVSQIQRQPQNLVDLLVLQLQKRSSMDFNGFHRWTSHISAHWGILPEFTPVWNNSHPSRRAAEDGHGLSDREPGASRADRGVAKAKLQLCHLALAVALRTREDQRRKGSQRARAGWKKELGRDYWWEQDIIYYNIILSIIYYSVLYIDPRLLSIDRYLRSFKRHIRLPRRDISEVHVGSKPWTSYGSGPAVVRWFYPWKLVISHSNFLTY